MKKVYWVLAIGYLYVLGYIFLSRISESLFLSSIEPTIENILKSAVFLVATFFLEVGDYLYQTKNAVLVLPIIILVTLFILFEKRLDASLPLRLRQWQMPSALKNLSIGVAALGLMVVCPYKVWLDADKIFNAGKSYVAIRSVPFFDNFYWELSDVIVRSIVPGNITPCEIKQDTSRLVSITFPAVTQVMANWLNFKNSYVQIAYTSDIDQRDMRDHPTRSIRYAANTFLLHRSEHIHPTGYCLYNGHNVYYHKKREILDSDVFANSKSGQIQKPSLLVITKEGYSANQVDGSINVKNIISAE